jgi:hypothetical protein
MTPEQAAFVLRVLQVTAAADSCSDIWWRTDETYAPVVFLVGCNDLFFWACADAERLTPQNIDLLEQAYLDTEAVGCRWNGASLFCARVRKMRPQSACYPKDEPQMWPLYDACGPPRDVDFGNPHKHPDEGRRL